MDKVKTDVIQVPFADWRVRTVVNTYGNAFRALYWFKEGHLIGNPIRLTDHHFHVYGIWERDWSQVFIEFTDKRITVVVPRKHSK